MIQIRRNGQMHTVALQNADPQVQRWWAGCQHARYWWQPNLADAYLDLDRRVAVAGALTYPLRFLTPAPQYSARLLAELSKALWAVRRLQAISSSIRVYYSHEAACVTIFCDGAGREVPTVVVTEEQMQLCYDGESRAYQHRDSLLYRLLQIFAC